MKPDLVQTDIENVPQYSKALFEALAKGSFYIACFYLDKLTATEILRARNHCRNSILIAGITSKCGDFDKLLWVKRVLDINAELVNMPSLRKGKLLYPLVHAAQLGLVNVFACLIRQANAIVTEKLAKKITKVAKPSAIDAVSQLLKTYSDQHNGYSRIILPCYTGDQAIRKRHKRKCRQKIADWDEVQAPSFDQAPEESEEQYIERLVQIFINAEREITDENELKFQRALIFSECLTHSGLLHDRVTIDGTTWDTKFKTSM